MKKLGFRRVHKPLRISQLGSGEDAGTRVCNH